MANDNVKKSYMVKDVKFLRFQGTEQQLESLIEWERNNLMPTFSVWDRGVNTRSGDNFSFYQTAVIAEDVPKIIAFWEKLHSEDCAHEPIILSKFRLGRLVDMGVDDIRVRCNKCGRFGKFSAGKHITWDEIIYDDFT